MSPAARRVLTFLPPLVVLGGILALVLPASIGDGARGRAEASIRTRWDAAAEAPAVRQDLAVYLDRYGKAEDARWFAITAYARIGDLAAAFDTWRREPSFVGSRAAMRKFADVALRALAHVPGDPTRGSVHEPRGLQARVEAGDEEAVALLRAKALSVGPTEVLPWYGPIHRTHSRASDVLSKGLLEAGRHPEARAAGAAIASRPSDRSQVAFLAEKIASAWAVERPFMWQHMVRALGTAGGPEALAALRTAREANLGQGPEETMRRQALDVGLALAGDAAARERVFTGFAHPLSEMTGVQLAIGLRAQLLDGVAGAGRTLVELWKRAPGPTTRLQVGVSCLLSDPLPPPEVPCDAWADELAGETARLPRVLAHAWRFRKRQPGAEADLVRDLDEALHATNLARATAPDENDVPEAMEVLRAWLRWGG